MSYVILYYIFYVDVDADYAKVVYLSSADYAKVVAIKSLNRINGMMD